MEIIEDGFWAMLEKYAPGKTEAEIMAPAVEKFFAGGAGLADDEHRPLRGPMARPKPCSKFRATAK